MQISIDSKVLTEALFKLLGVTTSRGPLSIVANALLTASDDNTLTLQATDLEVTISTTCPCEVKASGQLCLNAHNLYNVVKGLKNHRVDITALDNQWAQLNCKDVDCRIVGVPPMEFPRLPTFVDLTYFSVPKEIVVQMVERTIFCISTDEGRPNLMGSFLIGSKNGIRMTSTDGHRLSTVERALENISKLPESVVKGVIIPRKSLAEIKRTVSGDVTNVELAVSGNNAIFKFSETTIMVRLVEATFPDYSRVVPEIDEEKQGEVDTNEFIEKLKFVSLFSNPRTCNVSVQMEGDQLELSASDPEKGEGKEVMAIKYGGAKVQVGFNFRYLLDVLGVIGSSTFNFQITDAYSAALLMDKEYEADLFLIMPMRI